MTAYYVDIDDDDNIIVMDEDNNCKVSNDKTAFILCKRCIKKNHYGAFENNVFRCMFVY